MPLAYRCPHCYQSLIRSERCYHCPNAHSFDISREGYVNLLPVQQKKSRQPGDSEAMISARRRFLDRGYYLPLRKAIQAQLLAQEPITCLLDLGCGDGWYTGGLPWGPAAECHGIDISRPAIKLAAKRHRDVHYAVASSYGLPFGEAVFSHALNVFAPLDPSELARVMRPAGLLLRVSPAPNHLFALKALLYEQPRHHDPEGLEMEGFELITSQRLEQGIRLEALSSLNDLIQMTPYAWKLNGQLDLAQVLPFDVELDVWLSLFRKH